MKEKAGVHALIIDRIRDRLIRLGMQESEVTADLDLVRSGVLDSLSFVDLIGDLESASGKQVDLEKALEKKGATTVKAIVELFEG